MFFRRGKKSILNYLMAPSESSNSSVYSTIHSTEKKILRIPGNKKVKIITCDASRFFFRFRSYQDTNAISATALDIRCTPHYGLARKYLYMRKHSIPIDEIPESEEYKKYELYKNREAKILNKRAHSTSGFLQLLKGLSDVKLALENNPIRASKFGKLSSGKKLYYILDGAHRTAYAAAYQDIMKIPMKVPILTYSGDSPWVEIKDINFGDEVVKIYP